MFAAYDPAEAAQMISGLFRQSQQAARRTYADHAVRFSRRFLGTVPLSVRLEPGKGLVVEAVTGTPGWMRGALALRARGQATDAEFVFPYGSSEAFHKTTALLRRAGIPIPDFTASAVKAHRGKRPAKGSAPADGVIPPPTRTPPKHGR